MRRVAVIAFAIALLGLLALPAFGTTTTVVDEGPVIDVPTEPTEDTNAEGPTTAAVIAGIATFGLIVKQVVAAVKRAAPTLNGVGTMGVATLAGTILAALFDFQTVAALADNYNLTGVVNRVPDGFLGWVISGIAIMAMSGFLAELAGTSGPKAVLATAQAKAVNNTGYVQV